MSMQLVNPLVSMVPIFFFSGTASADSGPPRRLSELRNIDGIRLDRGPVCKACCELEFAEDFGKGNGSGTEQALLRGLSLGPSNFLANDMNCARPILAYVALEHIYFLANTHGELWAARFLVNPSGPGFDGEIAEVFPGEYIIPILQRSDNPAGLLDPAARKKLATRICSWAKVEPDRWRTKRRLRRLARHLRARSVRSLAEDLEKCVEEE